MKVTDINVIRLNNKSVKIFKLWRNIDGAWVFAGQYTAPAKTANKNLYLFAE